jgi:tRNA (guanine-N7-)-methyltransferase
MKPKDLKAPFKWDERRVHYEDRVLYVPEYWDKWDTFEFPGWEALFGNACPLKIEYCSGNGAWVLNRAQEYPEGNWIAIEKKFVRVRKIWSKIQNHTVKNLIAICGEGMKVSRHFLAHGCAEEVFINFPDPWPKKRHAKHRLIQPPFVAELWRILREGGKVHLVTDDPDYSAWMIAVMNGHTGFKSSYPAPYYITEMSEYGTSWFDALWRSKGRTIRYHQFQKV